MQSDDRVTAALTGVRPQIAQYRFAVSATLERARALLASESGPKATGIALGDFAAGRIDPERFAMISAGAAPLDVMSRAVIERAIEALEGLLTSGDQLFVILAPPGVSASAAISARLAKLGAAFGIAGLVEQVRRRVYEPVSSGFPFEEHPFEKWTTGERRLTPPLIIRMSGADFDPFEIARFVDGSAKLVFLFEEPCASAPLVRLISPGVFVAQTNDVSIVARAADLAGPAIIGIVSGSEALFTHEPRSGAMWQRLTVAKLPDVLPKKSLGRRSAAQQREDLALLGALAEQPVFPANPADALVAAIGAGGPAADPVDRLADWVLGQSAAGTA